MEKLITSKNIQNIMDQSFEIGSTIGKGYLITSYIIVFIISILIIKSIITLFTINGTHIAGSITNIEDIVNTSDLTLSKVTVTYMFNENEYIADIEVPLTKEILNNMKNIPLIIKSNPDKPELSFPKQTPLFLSSSLVWMIISIIIIHQIIYPNKYLTVLCFIMITLYLLK